jgi:hypothetical protein
MLRIFGTAGAGFAMCGCPVSAADHNDRPPNGTGAQGPLHAGHAHFCGIHIAKKDPKIQIITQHYCAAHSTGENGDDMFQCVLFDTHSKNAKLLGVEYLISDNTYRQLPDEEKKYWHPHTYEVLGGLLIAPNMIADEEKKFMKAILTTWGKAWHTWPDPKSAVPMGEPILIWSLTGDGQVDEKVAAKRDRDFNVSMAKISEQRCREFGLEPPQVSLPKSMDTLGRQWTDEGEDKPKKKN